VKIRGPAAAGKFYPAGVDEIRKLVSSCLHKHELGPKAGRGKPEPINGLIAAVVPHAGIIYSGAAAAHVYARIPKGINTIILLGPNHTGLGDFRVSASSADGWKTPLGVVECDLDVAKALVEHCNAFGGANFCGFDDLAHLEEHSLEVQLPFLQEVLDHDSFKIVPFVVSSVDTRTCEAVGKAIAQLIKEAPNGMRFLIIASSDFSHYVPAVDAKRLDGFAINEILRIDAPGLLRTVIGNRISMCGIAPTASMLYALKELGVVPRAQAVKHAYYNSGDIIGDKSSVVGYAGITIAVPSSLIDNK